MHNIFLKPNEGFSHHICVINDFQCGFVKTHAHLLFFRGLCWFWIWFVDKHAQVDVWRTFHMLGCSLKNWSMYMFRGLSFTNFETKFWLYKLDICNFSFMPCSSSMVESTHVPNISFLIDEVFANIDLKKFLIVNRVVIWAFKQLMFFMIELIKVILWLIIWLFQFVWNLQLYNKIKSLI